jgi:uncharacterized membrane protein
MSCPPPPRPRSRTSLGLFFIAAGINHFVAPKPYERIVPPGMGEPKLMVQISGVAEIAGGMGVLLPPTRRAAGWGLIALLIAIFPANVYMALAPEKTLPPKAQARIPRWALWARLPVQPVLIRWVRSATRT